ncbi:Uncharacterized protein SCF082_LOCUS10080 [Durusdinium trenchii]|uniref:Uncharacterized protein n=1 Tax=Durusdinium trenchii TaxID=1381693 RepID=A0ABP0J3L5_9DINO
MSATPPTARPTAKEGVDIYRSDASVSDIFGDLKGRILLEAIWTTYQAGIRGYNVGPEKTRVKFYQESNNAASQAGRRSGFAGQPKNIYRHPLNNRAQNGVRECYKQSVKLRGIVEGVRGEAWLTEPGICPRTGERSGPYEALSYASLVESFFAALEEEPGNQNLLITLSKGLECRVLHHRIPPAIAKYLIHLRNRFHQGSSTSFCELLTMVPDVDSALQAYKLHTGIKWAQKDYETRCAEFIKTHPEFGETFSSWTLYESARGCYNVFEKKWQMLSGAEGVIQKLGETVDFLNPKLCNSSVLQCMLHAVNTVTIALFDGVEAADMRILLLEIIKLCVLWQHYSNLLTSVVMN